MKFEDISKELNIPLWKVKNIYFSGINKLRREIKNNLVLETKLREYLEELSVEDIPYRSLLETILYDSYGKDKL